MEAEGVGCGLLRTIHMCQNEIDLKDKKNKISMTAHLKPDQVKVHCIEIEIGAKRMGHSTCASSDLINSLLSKIKI